VAGKAKNIHKSDERVRIMTVNLRGRVAPLPIIVAVVCFAVWLVPRSKSASASDDAGVRPPAFRIGEVLNYRIDWQHYTGAGVAQLQIVDRGDFYGLPAWHFRASIHTAQPVRALYPMDDQIDSYAMVAGLEGREYQEHFREFGKPDDTTATLIAPGEISDAPAPRVIVPAGTRDALSAVYLLRVTNWRAQQELRVPVYDGQNVYEMVAKADEPSELHVATGNYHATEIEINLLDGGKEISDENFRIWLADDAERTPLVCEAYLPIGTLRIELTSDSAYEGQAVKRPTLQERSSLLAGN
jgi:hypothetical protein